MANSIRPISHWETHPSVPLYSEAPVPAAEASDRTAVMKRPNHKDALDQTDHGKGRFLWL